LRPVSSDVESSLFIPSICHPEDKRRKDVYVQPETLQAVLNDPIAQELIQSNIPARLAYTTADGSPRVIPIGFHWNGAEFILCTVPDSPKVRALSRNPQVAMTVDTNTFPPHVLLVRGTARQDVVNGVPPEYLEAARKQVAPEQMPAFESQVRGLYKQMVRIAVTPTWAKILDFETRLPSPVEKLIHQASAQA
jgi:hypothetical protein